MDALPIILIILFLVFFFGRIKIPKGLKPVPAIELEVPKKYQISVRINGKDFATLPLSEKDLEDFKRDKKNLSKSNFCLKHKPEDKSKIEVLLNLSDFVYLEDDSFAIDLDYKKPDGNYTGSRLGEIDYSLAYIHNGKLLLASDIEEQNIRFEDEGQISLTFENLAERVEKRIKRFSKD